LRSVESPHIVDRRLDGRDLPPFELRLRVVEFLRRHLQRFELRAVKALGKAQQRGITVAPDFLDDGARQLLHVVQRIQARTGQRLAAPGGIQFVPVQYLHVQSSIFSTGSTSMALAPAAFRLSSVSQNTFSRHTACTATLSVDPSSGMMVGDSLPGSSSRMRGRAERGACSMMYLLSFTCSTPSMRSSSRSIQSSFTCGSFTGVRISTTWLASTVCTSRRWLACSVEPEDTRSQIMSARPSRGAISTAPDNVTISASMPLRLKKSSSSAG